MATDTADDVYDDPDNIFAENDDVGGATELPDNQRDDLSQSIYAPELADDDRGPIDALATSMTDQEGAGGEPIEDIDAYRLTDAQSPEELDGTEG
jgi:hypothetical protein